MPMDQIASGSSAFSEGAFRLLGTRRVQRPWNCATPYAQSDPIPRLPAARPLEAESPMGTRTH